MALIFYTLKESPLSLWPLRDAQWCCFSTFILTHSCHVSTFLMSSLSLPLPFIFVFQLNQECLLRFLMLERTVLWGCCWGWAIFPGPLHSHGSCQQVPPALLNDQMREGGCAVLLISPITVQRPLLGLPNLHCIETRLLPMAAFLLTNGFETYSFLPIWEQFFEATHP